MTPDWVSKYIGLEYGDACWGPTHFDCWGLIAHVYKQELDIDLLTDMPKYGDRRSKVRRLHKHLHKWLKTTTPEIGDGILFLIGGKLPHCGIYIGNGMMLHSIEGVSSCIQRLDDAKWKPRLEGYYRYSSGSS